MSDGVSETPDAGTIEEDIDILNDEGGGGDGGEETGADGGTSEETGEEGEGEGGDGAEEETGEEGAGEAGEGEPGDVEDPDAVKEEDKKPEEPTHQQVDNRLIKAIDKKFPEFLKSDEGKQLRAAFWQRNQYAEHFATPEEAKEAAEDLSTFREYEKQVDAGNPELLITSILKNEEASEKFLMNLLPTLEKHAPAMNAKVLFPFVHRIFSNALSDAKAAGNKQLEYSVGHLAKFLWGRAELPPANVPRAATEETPELKKLREQNEANSVRIRTSFQTRVYDSAESQFRNTILTGLKDDKRFTPIEKRALADSIDSRVRDALDKDPRHLRAMRTLWQKAQTEGYPDGLIPRITRAFLGGANQLLPTLRARVLAEALREKGMAPAGKGRQPGTPNTGGSPKVGGKVVSSRDVDYERTSDEDILSDDPARIRLKGQTSKRK